jgi:hypothetical protein
MSRKRTFVLQIKDEDKITMAKKPTTSTGKKSSGGGKKSGGKKGGCGKSC